MRSSFFSSFASVAAAAGCALLGGLCACGGSKEPVPDKEAAPVPSGAPSSTSGAMNAAPSSSAAPQGPPAVATVTLKKFAPPDGSSPEAIFAVEGALLVAAKNRVGRITGDTVEWIGEIPKETRGYGRNIIQTLHGKWPDSIDVIYFADNGRAPRPTYAPLTGKGKPFAPGGGGDVAWITGIAASGESTVVMGYAQWLGAEMAAVRGPSLGLTPLLRELSSCKRDEIANQGRHPAVSTYAFGSTAAGTLVSAGAYCEDQGYAAEFWDVGAKKSRIVEISQWVKKMGVGSKLLQAKGDELWLYSDEKSPILHYKEGQFRPLPAADKPLETAFVSWNKQLHASDGQTIYRYEGDRWITVARLTWPAPRVTFVMDEKDRFWAYRGSVFQLVPGADTAFQDGCATPFVYLYDVSPETAKNFTFPVTRKALSTFAGAAEVSLVDFDAEGARRLGIVVSGKAQGEAVIAHMKASMKDEDPRLICYKPENPHKIDLGPKGK